MKYGSILLMTVLKEYSTSLPVALEDSHNAFQPIGPIAVKLFRNRFYHNNCLAGSKIGDDDDDDDDGKVDSNRGHLYLCECIQGDDIQVYGNTDCWCRFGRGSLCQQDWNVLSSARAWTAVDHDFCRWCRRRLVGTGASTAESS